MRSISYLKSAGKFLKPEFVTSLKLALQDIGKYKNIAAIKLGIKNTINYTKFAFKSTDNYLDIIIHAKGNKFYVVVEGVVQEKSSKEIISIIDNAPTGKTARLLSCNDEAAAIALSIETKKPFYASDGWVEINKNGDVFSEKDFYLYNRGTKGAKGSNYTKGNAPEGVEYLRLGDGVNGPGRHANWVEILDIRNKINLKVGHVIENLDINSAGTKFTGCHSEISLQNHIAANPTSRYEFRNPSYDVNSGIDDASRVFEAKPVVIKADGSEMIKGNNQGVSSFFPKNWDKNKILDEVEYVIANNHGRIPEKPTGTEYFGFSKDGKVEIHFYLNADGSIGSYFPKKR